MSDTLEFVNAMWPARTSNGQARANALREPLPAPQPTSLIEFHSKGRLLILGDAPRALSVADRLAEALHCTVLARPGSGNGTADERLIYGVLTRLDGHLGHFDAHIEVQGQDTALASTVGAGDFFDLVLDLGSPPQLTHETPPLGYYAPGEDAAALERALTTLPDLVGEFEKPKYFNLDPSICAHGRAGITGCRRCIEACPTLAITSVGESIRVSPYLCQGGGSCATACPTGAITYAYPLASDLLDAVRTLLGAYRAAGGEDACVMFFDSQEGAALAAEGAEQLPEEVLPIPVEEIGSVGMDTWLTVLAYGASHVAVLGTSDTPPSVWRELRDQSAYAQAILEGMGYDGGRLLVVQAASAAELADALTQRRPQPPLAPASYVTFNEKRKTIRFALEHLAALTSGTPEPAPLPEGAPFGEVHVDRDACTLCMACVSVCPAQALRDGDEAPQLRFVEANCVQCGLCRTACPERAISLAPRIVYGRDAVFATRVLNEEEPFRCVVCGKPFATRKMMERMKEKLGGHWMFQSGDALRRLQMCETCRVADIYTGEGGLDVYDKPH